MREFSEGITYTQIATFKAIYEAGNISKAAKLLGVSAASVSHSLKLLEARIKEPLFARTTRAIKPTETGTQLYQSVRFAIDELATAVEVISDQNKSPRGRLSLNMAKNIYDVFLKDILRDFRKEFPTIQLEISLSDFMDQRIESAIDIGFRFGETVHENLVARPIGKRLRSVRLALAASPDYVREIGQPTSVEDLHDHAFIKFRAPTSRQLLPVRLHKSSDPTSEIVTLSNLRTAMVTNNTEVVIDMAVQGAGVCYLMDAMIEEQFDSGELAPLLEQQWCDPPNIYMYYAPENRQTSRVRCFLDFIDARMEAGS